MVEPKVGQIICFRVTGDARIIGPGEWSVDEYGTIDQRAATDGHSVHQHYPLEPIDPARVTIAPKPERFTVTGFGGVECDGRVLFTCVDTLNALDACKSLNALDRAAKEATDVKA